jgi:hypothetical protein
VIRTFDPSLLRRSDREEQEAYLGAVALAAAIRHEPLRNDPCKGPSSDAAKETK